SNPNTIYESGPDLIDRSDDGGVTWAAKTSGISAGFGPVPFVIDPSNSSRLLLGTTRLYETTDRGDSWHQIGGFGMNGWNTAQDVVGIAISPTDPNTIYVSVGSQIQGHVLVTFNDGASWQTFTVPGFADEFAQIAVDPTNTQVAYLVRAGFTNGPGGHVF